MCLSGAVLYIVSVCVLVQAYSNAHVYMSKSLPVFISMLSLYSSACIASI